MFFCVQIYLYIYICIFLSIYICKCCCICIRIRIRIRICICICVCVYIYTCICMSVYVNIFIGSLDRKLRNYRWLSWLAFPPSCQPDHHVSHLIVSTTNYQVGGKRNSSEACKFTGESTPWHENPAFFWVMWLLGSPKYNRVSVSTFPRLHLGKLSEKSAQNYHSFIRFVAGSWIS